MLEAEWISRLKKYAKFRVFEHPKHLSSFTLGFVLLVIAVFSLPELRVLLWRFSPSDSSSVWLSPRTKLEPYEVLLHNVEVLGSSLSPMFSPEVGVYDVRVEGKEVANCTVNVEVADSLVDLVVYAHDVYECNSTRRGTFTLDTRHPDLHPQDEPWFHLWVGSRWNSRNITMGPLGYGINKVTLAASAARPIAGKYQRIHRNYTLLIYRPSEFEHRQLKVLEVNETDACIQYDRSGLGYVGSGRSMWVLRHCQTQAHHSLELRRDKSVHRLAEIERLEPLPFENVYIAYVAHHYTQIHLRPEAIARCSTVLMMGVEIPRGEVSPPILMTEDRLLVTLTVVAKDGNEGIYRIHIVRLAAMPPPPLPPAPSPPPHPVERFITRREYHKRADEEEYEKKHGKAMHHG